MATTTNNQFGGTAASNTDATEVAKQAPTDATRDLFTKLLVAQIQTQDPLPQKNWEIPAPQSMSPLGWKLNVQQAIPQTVYTRTGGE